MGRLFSQINADEENMINIIYVNLRTKFLIVRVV
jgi:hypothetical protein